LDVNGELRIGSTAIACSGTNAGAIRYSGGAVQFCNGTAWANIASAGSVAISGLTAASAINTINNTTYLQEWQWNALAGATGLKLSSTSTAAASNAQKLLEIALSGANATAAQTTYGASILNTHTGTTSTNIGLFVGASGDTAAQTIAMARETTAATAGRDLTISAGGAKLAGTNLDGGNLILKPGQSTGNGDSNIYFSVYNKGSPGAGTGEAVNFNVARISGSGLNFAYNTSIEFNTMGSNSTDDLYEMASKPAFQLWSDTGNDLFRIQAAPGGASGSSVTFSDAISINGTGSVAINSTQTTLAAKFVVAPPTAETIGAGATITANACGTVKLITSTAIRTTNTTDTFASSTASYAGCCMDVLNTGSFNITLDANAKFKTAGAADQVLGTDDTLRVCSNGTNWYQVGAISANQ
jgi:hypothetical protein